MAETTITPTQVSSMTGVVITPGTGTAINAANTIHIAYPKDGDLFVIIDSDHADTSASFGAGFGVASGRGATAVAVADTVQKIVAIGESSRYLDADGDVVITWAASSAGFLFAFYVPKIVQ